MFVGADNTAVQSALGDAPAGLVSGTTVAGMSSISAVAAALTSTGGAPYDPIATQAANALTASGQQGVNSDGGDGGAAVVHLLLPERVVTLNGSYTVNPLTDGAEVVSPGYVSDDVRTSLSHVFRDEVPDRVYSGLGFARSNAAPSAAAPIEPPSTAGIYDEFGILTNPDAAPIANTLGGGSIRFGQWAGSDVSALVALKQSAGTYTNYMAKNLDSIGLNELASLYRWQGNLTRSMVPTTPLETVATVAPFAGEVGPALRQGITTARNLGLGLEATLTRPSSGPSTTLRYQ